MGAETATLKAGYQVRRANIADLHFIMRAQAASEYELEPMTEDEIAGGLLNGRHEAYIIEGSRSKMMLTVQREGNKAVIAALYREGPPHGLWTEGQILWEKVVDALQATGVTSVYAFVHRQNPQLRKLVKFYRRFAFDWDTVRLMRTI